MKNKNKLWLISFGCIGIGLVLLLAGMLLGGRPGFYIDRTGVHSPHENRSDTPHIQEKMKLDEFSSIDINVNYADIQIQPSDGYYIEYQLDGNDPEPTLEVKNGKLRFKEASVNGIIGFNIASFSDFSRISYDYQVTLYVPSDRYFSSVKLVSEDGKIRSGHLNAGTLDIHDDYGQVEIESFQGKELNVNMDDGDFILSNGHCENLNIDNEYGNVMLGMSNQLDTYDFNLETEYGRIEVEGSPEMSNSDDEARFKSNNGAAHQVKVRCNDGNIVITQAK